MGLAVGLAQLAQLSPVDGPQEKLLAPEAVSNVLPPLQIALLPVTNTVGTVFTATVTVAVFVQPLLPVPVTVYVVLAVGEAIGLAHAVQESVAPGLQT